MRNAFVAVTLGMALAAGPAGARQIDTLALRSHTYYLANDLLEGRGTGTRGSRAAGLYIAAQLQRIGIPGAGPNGSYFQAVPLRRATPDPRGTRVAITAGADTVTLELGRDFIWGRGGVRAFRPFQGEALFIGPAAEAARITADADVAGRVLVMLGTLPADQRWLTEDWLRRGATGLVALATNEAGFRDYARVAGGPHTFVAVDVDDPVWQSDLPTVVAGPAAVEAIMAHAPPAARELAAGRGGSGAVPLPLSVNVAARFTFEDFEDYNVAALLPGSDPARRDQIVAFTAHYDHLGIGDPDANGDSIYNGFSDNAAGVAMLLAIAETVAKAPPARSLLFLFFTGEELGLLGSEYYATRPLLPLQRVTAVVNVDGGAPPAPPVQWRIAGGHASTLGQIAEAIGAEHGWAAQSSNTSPNSDHWPFFRRRIPAVFVIPGLEWEGLGSLERERLAARWDRYHQAGDHWDPEFPFVGLQRYAELAMRIGLAAANSPEPARWLEAPADAGR